MGGSRRGVSDRFEMGQHKALKCFHNYKDQSKFAILVFFFGDKNNKGGHVSSKVAC